jgi:hypothetical protein
MNQFDYARQITDQRTRQSAQARQRLQAARDALKPVGHPATLLRPGIAASTRARRGATPCT